MDPFDVDTWYYGKKVVDWLQSIGGMVGDKNFLRYHMHQYTGGRVSNFGHARYTKSYADGRQKKS